MVKALVDCLAVSEATVRRDLRSLADSGLVDLICGGAALPRPTDFSFHSKGMRNIKAKRIIGRLAAGLVHDYDQILMDSGTTSFQMVPHLKRKRGLTIIANSTRLSMELDSQGIKVIMLGGQYRPDRMDTIGPIAARTLKDLRGYTAFIGADALSMDFGLMASDIESADVYALAVRNSNEAVLLADSSKFLSTSLYKIVDFSEVAKVVTERRPSDDWMSFLDERGIVLICPEEGTEQDEE
jgi:DeoR/GlpR family transcriptional regulator of sugar metabolism